LKIGDQLSPNAILSFCERGEHPKRDEKILKMEHKIYPEVVNLFAMKKISVKENKVLIKDEKKLNLFIKNI